MNLNRKTLSRLLSLNDEELAKVIKSLAKESGIDENKLEITPNDIANIRKTLSVASDEEIIKLTQQFTRKK